MTHHIRTLTGGIQSLLDEQRDFVVITLVAIRGSAPQVLGAQAVVATDGLCFGTVGGGKIEAAAVKHAQQILNSQHVEPELVKWNLQTDIGMTCGGEVQLFFQRHGATTWPIAVFGAGHVAQGLVRLLLTLDCQITCIDPRQEWLDKLPDDPKLNCVCSAMPAELVVGMPDRTFFVLMSQGHATDLPVLAEILRSRKPPFVGVIGSRQKASVLRRDLQSEGLTEELASQFQCPIGLKLGNNTPSEIAVSIVAQLIEVRDNGV
ncbi:MAG TPA: xanthine dehydrogenase accessory protein XdhC [Planctomycetaceae bacterium]|nr:xanthine dehydrogenase accessory protein XdhC [Planctomycetaceae bacterium]